MNVTRPCYDPKKTGTAPAWEEIANQRRLAVQVFAQIRGDAGYRDFYVVE